MERSFDFGRLLKNHEKKHKSKPSQFGSVAGGVQKRLETNLKYRKSSRLTVFDNLRNLSKCESPAPVSNMQSKVEHRRQQLEKWKEEKEKKKKEAASQKKKPFVAGVPHAPLKFVPPPPPPKSMPMPSTSGRVTRSQSARSTVKAKETKDNKVASQSFAPKNASFRPPELKTMTKLPKLAPPKTRKDKKHNLTFDPVLPITQKECGKQTRSKIIKDTKVEPKVPHKQNERPIKTKVANPAPKTKKVIKAPLQSSSSSELESISEKSPILTSKVLRKSIATVSSSLVSATSSRKSGQNITPNRPVPRSESSSEERLRSPKSLEDIPVTPAEVVEEINKISPRVTMSRGKDNARREMKKKLEEGLLDEDASNIDSVDHFRKQLASEIKRMTEMCDTWDKISEQTVLPETIQEAVLSAVGQARLLMSQKLQQFASLVERCARPEPGSALVTPADLHGFWDMVFMQVENVDIRFKKLEQLRLGGWVEDKPVEEKKKVVRAVNVKKANKPAAGPSRLREMIAAARKAKKEQEVAPASTLKPPAEGNSKTFEAGFFNVRSPVRSPAPASPAQRTPASKSSLLKAVLSSEAKKASANKNSTSFAMLRASVFGKNVECDGIALLPQTPKPMTPINLYATPGRSILKGKDTKSTRKSIKMVLFNRSDTDLQDISYHTPDSDINETRPDDVHTDSGISSMDLEKVENKENSRRKSKLVRQDAEDRSPVVTRSRRKSTNTIQEGDAPTPRRSSRKKVLHETEDNVVEEKTKRSSRRRKSGVHAQD